MVRKTADGISGVLETLLTKPSESIGPAEIPPSNDRRMDKHSEANVFSEEQSEPSRSRICARRGRPPSSSSNGGIKQKVTVRVQSELIDVYRDWSWEVRSSLSQLVERALMEYCDQRRK